METGGVKRLAAQPQVSSRQMKANRHYATSNQLAFQGGAYGHCHRASPELMADRRALNATGWTTGSSERHSSSRGERIQSQLPSSLFIGVGNLDRPPTIKNTSNNRERGCCRQSI
jgi:hypothetical protein